jgi:hypothetical protein
LHVTARDFSREAGLGESIRAAAEAVNLEKEDAKARTVWCGLEVRSGGLMDYPLRFFGEPARDCGFHLGVLGG